ncbi:MAG: LysR family transcriptional regulator, partial [Burkholderiales bacterium]
LSLHTCVLELDAGVLKLLPLPGNPIERDWFVMHLASRQLPQVALAFEQFLSEQAQAQIQRQLGHVGGVPKTAKKKGRTVAAPPVPPRKRIKPTAPD